MKTINGCELSGGIGWWVSSPTTTTAVCRSGSTKRSLSDQKSEMKPTGRCVLEMSARKYGRGYLWYRDYFLTTTSQGTPVGRTRTTIVEGGVSVKIGTIAELGKRKRKKIKDNDKRVRVRRGRVRQRQPVRVVWCARRRRLIIIVVPRFVCTATPQPFVLYVGSAGHKQWAAGRHGTTATAVIRLFVRTSGGGPSDWPTPSPTPPPVEPRNVVMTSRTSVQHDLCNDDDDYIL